MPDREKVIEGLECVIRKMEGGVHVCDECPYDEDFNCLGCSIVLWQSLALLREQEPIRRSEMYFCGDCKTAIARTMNYCHKCGRKVKWDA